MPKTTPYPDFRWTTQIESFRRLKPHQNNCVRVAVDFIWQRTYLKMILENNKNTYFRGMCLQKCTPVWLSVIESSPHISHESKYLFFENLNVINVQYDP